MDRPAASTGSIAPPDGGRTVAAPAAAVVYVGDEIASVGWRLAGAHTVVPPPGGEAAALDAALARASPAAASLVLVSAAVAARLDGRRLQAAVAALAPLVLVVPDTQGTTAVPALAQRLAAQLGLDAGALTGQTR